MTQKTNELWDDVEMQLELSEGFYEPGNPRFYSLRGFPGVRLSHEGGNDLLSVSNSNEAVHGWRTVVEVLSVQRREIMGLGDDFSGTALQLRFDSVERKRMVPFLTDVIQLTRSGVATDEAFEATLEDWKGRFRSIRLPLDREKQRGLFGELCVLSRLTSERAPQSQQHGGALRAPCMISSLIVGTSRSRHRPQILAVSRSTHWSNLSRLRKISSLSWSRSL